MVVFECAGRQAVGRMNNHATLQSEEKFKLGVREFK
jgi:hypothetical protein